METCTAEYAALTQRLEGLRCDAPAFVTLHNPLALQNWTFPLIELLLIAGAVACLVHAVRWYRHQGDASNLVLWISNVTALLLIEPITYFPNWFGLQDTMGLVFAHGQFSVQFLYDRLPLYIVAMYPVYSYVAYVIVQRTGILRRHNAFVGAVCVAFTFMCLFEIVDMVGPQWGWWVWNANVATSEPTFGTVPYASLQGFSLIIPFGITLITLLATKRLSRSRLHVLRDVGIVSVGVWPILVLGNLPTQILGLAIPLTSSRFYVTWLMLAGAAALTAYAFIGAYRVRRDDAAAVPDGARGDYFALACVTVYLAFCVVFWAAALPDYLAAVGEFTLAGAPTGSLAVAVAAFIASATLTAGAYVGTNRTPALDTSQSSRHRTNT